MGKFDYNENRFLMSVNLTFQRRLAAKVLKVGKNRVWLDPACSSTIAPCTSTNTVRKLCKDSLIVAKTVSVHSFYHASQRKAEKQKGRHCGLGSRKGAKNARCNSKTQHIKRVRALRKTVNKYHKLGKIASREKKQLRSQIKGNEFKSRKVLIEQIIKMRNKAAEEKEQQRAKEALVKKKAERGLRKTQAHDQKILNKIEALKSQALTAHP